MIKRTMIFVNSFKSDFKGKSYEICRFVDTDTLVIYSATNIKGSFDIGKSYTCSLEYKNNKLVVISAE